MDQTLLKYWKTCLQDAERKAIALKGPRITLNIGDKILKFIPLKSIPVIFPDWKAIIRKTKCFDFWERNVLFPKTKRSFFRTPKHPLPCPFPLNFSLLIITKKFGNLAKNRYICIV